ncbi:hypothetical protein ACF0H5_003161 [Mactra antiquata]
MAEELNVKDDIDIVVDMSDVSREDGLKDDVFESEKVGVSERVVCITPQNERSPSKMSMVTRRHSTGCMEVNENYDKFESENFTSGPPTNGPGHSRLQFIGNKDATRCCRFHKRRNALCDPFHMLMPQHVREKLEEDNEKRKTSVTRKLSQFFTVSLDLHRDEDLI